jgi:hypothetical protein
MIRTFTEIVPQRGRRLVRDHAAQHHGGVTADFLPDLERFWPSRRHHAFDELCRS